MFLPLLEKSKESLVERERQGCAGMAAAPEHAYVPERTHGCRPQVSHWAELFPGLEARET